MSKVFFLNYIMKLTQVLKTIFNGHFVLYNCIKYIGHTGKQFEQVNSFKEGTQCGLFLLHQSYKLAVFNTCTQPLVVMMNCELFSYSCNIHINRVFVLSHLFLHVQRYNNGSIKTIKKTFSIQCCHFFPILCYLSNVYLVLFKINIPCTSTRILMLQVGFWSTKPHQQCQASGQYLTTLITATKLTVTVKNVIIHSSY